MLSLVVPAHDEARRLPRTLESLRAFAATAGTPLELLIVDDGSRDDTLGAVRAWAGVAGELDSFACGGLHVRLLRNPENRGKGHSVRRGMLESRGDPILMYDADGSTPIEELSKLSAAMEQGAAVAIGSRDLPESILEPAQPWPRRALAGMFRGLRRRLLLPELRDTQCGFKLFRRDAALAIFERCREDGWYFDCEVLALAQQLGYPIVEVPIRWRNDSASRVRPLREALRAPAALLRIRRRVRDAR